MDPKAEAAGGWRGLFGRPNALCLVLLALVLLKAAAYWLFAADRFPGEPLSAATLYRAGDIQMYPPIADLARGEFGESVVFEHRGEGVRTSPLTVFSLHALLFRLFGAGAFPAADLLLAAGYFFVLRALGRLLAGPGRLADLAAALVALDGIEITAAALGIKIHFWGLRIPRPFLSEPLFALSLLLSLGLLARPGLRRPGAWLALGLALSGLVQADIFLAIGFSLAAGIAWLGACAREPRAFLVGGAWAMTGLAAGLGPFLWQRLHEHADLAARYGLIAVPRGTLFFLPQYTAQAALAALLCVLAFVATRRETGARAASGFLLLLCVAAYFALPASAFLLGKTIQPYHFPIALRNATSYALLASALLLLAAAGRRLSPAALQWARGLALLLPLVGLWQGLKDVRKLAKNPGHVRAESLYPEWDALASCRRDFAELVRELESGRHAKAEVLGTFDQQAACWWLTFRGGSLFLVEPTLSTRPDGELEVRLAAFCRLLGLDAAGFIEQLRRRYVLNFWFGLQKYQASTARIFAPLTDYRPEDRERILAAGLYDNWTLALPVPEEGRLARLHAEVPAELPGRLDLVLLTRVEKERGFRPAGFRVVWENATFQLWGR